MVFAQATGTMTGRVVDQAGAVMPGTTITATNVATGLVRDTVTNTEGLFSLPALPPGRYEIRAELPGFTPHVKENVELLTGATISVPFEMEIAAVRESLEVRASAPLIETTQSTVSSSIRQSEVQELPMLNRSLSSMMTLLPGAREVAVSGNSAHGHASSYVSFGGSAGRSFQMMVDGVDNKEDHCGGTTMQYSLEGVQEFQVFTSGFSAEYGKAPTAIVMATKSGTNQFRGSVFGYGRNEKLVAIDYFSDPANGGLGEQPYSRAQYGGSIGGPIVRDRAWFFGSVERVQQEFQIARPDQIYREQTLLEPLGIHARATRSVSQPFRDLLAQAKVNFQMGQNHSLFVTYGSQNGYVDNSFTGVGRTLHTSYDVLDRNDQTMWKASTGWTWVINSSTVNQFNVQFLYYKHANVYPECDPALCLFERLNFPSVSSGQSNAKTLWTNLENKVEIKNDFSKQLGSHGMKFGVDVITLPVYGGIFALGSPGNITFFHDPSVIVNNTNGLYPQGFQTPGIVRSITAYTGNAGDYHAEGSWSFAGYVQDDFKMSPRLTLNLGVRYDVYQYMNLGRLDQNRGYQVLQAVGNPYGALPEIDKNNVSPRVGFAWDVNGNGNDVIRGGFGLFFGQGLMNTYFYPNVQSNPTVYFPLVFANSTIGSGQLANFVYGVTPLPTAPEAPTEYPRGQSSLADWYDPALKDPMSRQYHLGLSHLFSQGAVFSVDYSRIDGRHGWRVLNINPLLDHDANPATPRVRPLSAETARVYGDPNLLGPVQVRASVNDSTYDEVAFKYEQRFARTAFQTNYTLAWARGYGGSSESSTQGSAGAPQIPSTTGGDIYAPWEWGPTSYDERHRVTLAGIFSLPAGFEVAPSFTVASPRPYTVYSGANPSGDGLLMVRDADGNFVGTNTVRGQTLVNLNARTTKHFTLPGDERKLSIFAEFYNILNRANFGANYGNRLDSPATFNRPVGYIGGSAASSSVPISFQVQFGGRFSF
jgi:hypothetical protein